jgi:glyoxylate reductase
VASVLFTYRPLVDRGDVAGGVSLLWPETALDFAQLATSHPEAEALVTLISNRIDANVLAARPALRVVANVAAGTDNVDIAAASRLGILVCNVPGVVEETTADLAFALILAGCRQMTHAEHELRAGRWTHWELGGHLGVDVHGASLGLVGYGTIGQAVGRRASGFGMTIRHHTRHPTGKPGWTESLGELLHDADVVSIHVPLTPETTGLIGRRELSLMRPTAVLVNTSRGGIVNEQALAAALEQNRLFAAGLDVYAQEPKVNRRLLDCPRTTLLPHIGSATVATRQLMEARALEAALCALAGSVPAEGLNERSWRRR